MIMDDNSVARAQIMLTTLCKRQDKKNKIILETGRTPPSSGKESGKTKTIQFLTLFIKWTQIKHYEK